MFLQALSGQYPVEFAKNGSPFRRKYYLYVSSFGYRWKVMSKFHFLEIRNVCITKDKNCKYNSKTNRRPEEKRPCVIDKGKIKRT